MSLICLIFIIKSMVFVLKDIRGVRLDNRKVFRAPGPRTKLLSTFLSFNTV